MVRVLFKLVYKQHIFIKRTLFTEMNKSTLSSRLKQLVPPLTNGKHKGEAGRIGVIGGSIEYTGAPYFSAISSLKVGADLVYVFCMKEAAPVIKSYSPELIVLPYLDDPHAIDKIDPWLDRLHVIVIGPGLGRYDNTLEVVEQLIKVCNAKRKPLVIDADGLYLVAQKKSVILKYSTDLILTPNVMELKRLLDYFEDDQKTKTERLNKFLNDVGSNVTVFCKGAEDEIFSKGSTFKMAEGGSGRRCGGQGDLLSGSLATFLSWALKMQLNKNEKDERCALACLAASRLTRLCNQSAFSKFGRSMTCTDMIHEIPHVFKTNFEV